MHLFLLHHADAVGPDVDPQRPLSIAGVTHAERLAEHFSARGYTAQAIWHSGKLRARQTAEPFLRRQPFAEFRMVRGLRPDDGPELILGDLQGETRQVIVAGHMPQLAETLRRLVDDAAVFPLHALIVLDRDGTGWRVVETLSE